MCDDLDEDDWYDDWRDDDYYESDEPDWNCWTCRDDRLVPARLFAARGRLRRCPSCDPNPVGRLRWTLRAWWLKRRFLRASKRGTITVLDREEAPF